MPTRSAAPQFELLFASPKMGAYTRLDADGVTRKYIGGVASSSMIDLKGSVISESGQEKMLSKLTELATKMADYNSGLTGFLNHEYDIPECVLGAFTGARLVTRDG